MGWGRRPKVAKLARKKDVKRLTAALGYRDYVFDRDDRVLDLGVRVRRDAALALMSLPDVNGVDVVSALITSLGDSSAEVRRAAAAALGGRRESRAVSALAEAALSWDDPRYEIARAAAAAALLEMSCAETIEIVVGIVIEQPINGERAEDLVKRMAERRDDRTAPRAASVAAGALSRSAGAAAGRASDLLVWLGADSVDPLLQLLREPCDVRTAAVEALGRIGDLRASKALSELQSDDDAAVRRSAAIALGQIADPRTVESLVASTRDPDQSVRTAALEALRTFGPLGVIPSTERHEVAPVRHLRPDGKGARSGTRISWFRH